MTAAPMTKRSPLEGFRSGVSAWVKAALVAAVFTTFFRRTFTNHFAYKWTHDGNWTHGWLIPLLSAYFLWIRRDDLARTEARPAWTGAAVLTAAVAAYLYFSWIQPIRYVQGLCPVAALAGTVLLLGGYSYLRKTGFAIAYLLLAVPLPQGVYVELTFPLRQLASVLAGAVLSLLPNVQVEVHNVIIDYVRFDTGSAGFLNVEEACSGMRLMMSFAALSLAYAHLAKTSAWGRAAIVLACLPIAVLCNAARVVATGLFVIYDRPDLARGTPHMLLGIATLFLALGMFAVVNWILTHLWVEDGTAAGS